LFDNPETTERRLAENTTLNPEGLHFLFQNTTINKTLLFELLFTSPGSLNVFSDENLQDSIPEGLLLKVLSHSEQFRDIFQKLTRRSEPVAYLPELFEVLKVNSTCASSQFRIVDV
jgi:hypothetical protein